MTDESIDQILAAVPIAMLHIGQDRRIRFFNPPATTLFGKGFAGRNYVTVLRQPVMLECVEQAFQKNEPAETVFKILQTSKALSFDVRAVPVSFGSQTGVVVSFTDTTPLEQAGQMRRDFVANVSHELRTPLTALLGFIETLRGAAKDDPSARERFLGIMQSEAERMNRLVDDLLSLSRVEDEERVRPTELHDIGALLTSATQSLRPVAAGLGVTIDINVETELVRAPADGDQLIQVFSNLLENAIKYGAKPGKVTATLSHVAHDPMIAGPALRIDVNDQGEGIESGHIARLTERFYRVDSHRSREMGGTGLGLAIVKHILNRHRGRLRISSEPGVGSCFSVTLPTA